MRCSPRSTDESRDDVSSVGEGFAELLKYVIPYYLQHVEGLFSDSVLGPLAHGDRDHRLARNQFL